MNNMENPIEIREEYCEHLCPIGLQTAYGKFVDNDTITWSEPTDDTKVTLFNFCPFCGQKLNTEVTKETVGLRFKYTYRTTKS